MKNDRTAVSGFFFPRVNVVCVISHTFPSVQGAGLLITVIIILEEIVDSLQKVKWRPNATLRYFVLEWSDSAY